MLFDPLHILVSDDQQFDRQIATSGLKRHRVVEATSLAETLDAILAAQDGGRPFDVILQDLDLGDSKGIDTWRKVKAAALGAPIVIYTGTSGLRLGQELLKDGAADYLVKDPDTMPTDIVRSLEFAARRHKAAAAARLKLAEAAREDASRLEAEAASLPPPAPGEGNEAAVMLRAQAGERRYQGVVIDQLADITQRLDDLRRDQDELRRRQSEHGTAIASGQYQALETAKEVQRLRDLTPANKRRLALGGGGAIAVLTGLLELLRQVGALDWLGRLGGG